jgi:hypothetical protein
VRKLSRGGSAGRGSLTRFRGFGSLSVARSSASGQPGGSGTGQRAKRGPVEESAFEGRARPSWLVAEVGRRCLAVTSGPGCGWGRGGRSSRARETASGEGASRARAQSSDGARGKGRKPSSPMEGVSARSKVSAFTGRRRKRARSVAKASESSPETADDGDARSPVAALLREPNKLAGRVAHPTEAGLGRVNGPAHLGASRGHPTKNGCSSLTCGLQKSAGRIFGVPCTRWAFTGPTANAGSSSRCEAWAALDGAPGGRAANGCAKPRTWYENARKGCRPADHSAGTRYDGRRLGPFAPSITNPLLEARSWPNGSSRSSLLFGASARGQRAQWRMVPRCWCPVGDRRRQKHERHGEGSSSRGQMAERCGGSAAPGVATRSVETHRERSR